MQKKHLHSLFAITYCALLTNTGASLAAGGHDHGHGHGDEDSGHADHADVELTKGPIRNYRRLTDREQAIQNLLNTYGDAMEQKSVALMEQAVIPGDFFVIESGYSNWTWEDFRDNHLKVEMEMFSNIDYEIDLVLGETQGSLGFAIYEYSVSGDIEDRSVSISGLGTAILEETEAGWRIHHLHTSAPREQLEAASRN